MSELRIDELHNSDTRSCTTTHVPTAVHVNAIRDRLVGMKEAEFRALKAAWSGRSVQTWDPFAPVGDARAAIPVQTQRPCRYPEQDFYLWIYPMCLRSSLLDITP